MERKLTRNDHELEAVRAVQAARRHLGSARANCDARSLESLIQQNRAVAHARTHLTGIGFADSKRTNRLWVAVNKAERDADASQKQFARCLVRR